MPMTDLGAETAGGAYLQPDDMLRRDNLWVEEPVLDLEVPDIDEFNSQTDRFDAPLELDDEYVDDSTGDGEPAAEYPGSTTEPIIISDVVPPEDPEIGEGAQVPPGDQPPTGGDGDRPGNDNGDGENGDNGGEGDEERERALVRDSDRSILAAGFFRMALDATNLDEAKTATTALYAVYTSTVKDLRAARQELDRQEAERHQAEQERDEALAEVLHMSHDVLMRESGVYTPQGLERLLTRDRGPEATAMREQIRSGKVGFGFLDYRFLTAINNLAGHESGNRYLARSAGETSAVIQGFGRFGAGRHVMSEETRREDDTAGNEAPSDIIVRASDGADELMVVFFGVDWEDMQGLADRIRSPLSVEAALEREELGRVPFIASTGFAHLEEEGLNSWLPELTSDEPSEAYQDLIREAFRVADARQSVARDYQYDRMWELAIADMSTIPPRPRETRVIADYFLRNCCPRFTDTLQTWAQKQE